MTHLEPDLARLGDALHTSATADLAATRATPAAQPPRRRARPRAFAGGTLGLAGVGTALVLALSGSATPAAFAITTNGDGSLTVNLDTDAGLVGANRKLAAMGTHEHIYFQMAQGPAAVSGPVNCVPQGVVSGPSVKVTVGPDDSNTETIASGNTGAGTWHVAACWRVNGDDTAGIPVGASVRTPSATTTTG